jgi:hypothetical protein
MRQLFFLVVLAAAGYVVYQFYQERFASSQREIAPDSVAEGPSDLLPAPAPATPAAPVFQSRIRPPAAVAVSETQLAPPGVLYMLERVSAETKNGVTAVVPGDEVRLLKRIGSKLKVAIGTTELEVKESQVTNNIALARDAEKREFFRRTGRRQGASTGPPPL